MKAEGEEAEIGVEAVTGLAIAGAAKGEAIAVAATGAALVGDAIEEAEVGVVGVNTSGLHVSDLRSCGWAVGLILT